VKRSFLTRTLIIVILALTPFFILTTLPLTSTAAPRLEPQPPESLTALNSAEATENSVRLSAFSASSAASVVQPPTRPSVSAWQAMALTRTIKSGVSEMSADDFYLAFHSDASNSVAGDAGGRADIVTRNRQIEVTARISVASDVTEANGDNGAPWISVQNYTMSSVPALSGNNLAGIVLTDDGRAILPIQGTNTINILSADRSIVDTITVPSEPYGLGGSLGGNNFAYRNHKIFSQLQVDRRSMSTMKALSSSGKSLNGAITTGE